MSETNAKIPRSPARIESLKVNNYRALKSLEIKDITPMTVLLGPNGSGKSTVFDVLNFLSECFQSGLRSAWDRRGRAKELKTRGQTGPIEIEIKYREQPRQPLITYYLAIEEESGKPFVNEEWLQWRRGRRGKPFRFLKYNKGSGIAVPGMEPDDQDARLEIPLRSTDLLAVNTLGQFAEHPRIAALREFIMDWHVSYLSIDDTRKQPEAGPQEHLNTKGDNLPNVVQYLLENHPQEFKEIVKKLCDRVPRLDDVQAKSMEDNRLALYFKDAPFSEAVLSRFVSDGTLKLLSYMILLNDPEPPQFIGIEEPENFLHPNLLPELAEECRRSTQTSQIIITTHSPFLLNEMKPKEVRILYRDDEGFTQVQSVDKIPNIKQFVDSGAQLGDLWLEGYFEAGNPLINSGMPAQR